jgi:hypothetical protein
MMGLSRTAVKRLLNHRSGYDVTDNYIISDVERFRVPVQQVADYLKERIGLSKKSNVVALRNVRT